MTHRNAANTMTQILGLRWSPVAVRFIPVGEPWPDFGAPAPRRFCQVLMEARRGEKRLLTPDTASCSAGAAALGLRPLPDGVTSGRMLAGFGVFASVEAGRHTSELIPRLEHGTYGAISVLPLGDLETGHAPDVVVVEALPEQVMWLALASIHDTGGRLELSTAAVQATCVDAAVLPFLTGRPNVTLGCYGCREATDLGPEECVIGLPGSMLAQVVTNLGKLAESAMARARAKAAFHHLQRSAGSSRDQLRTELAEGRS